MGKTIAIIPARAGSKRLPIKNIKMLNGIPLIAHSIKYALSNSNLIVFVTMTFMFQQIVIPLRKSHYNLGRKLSIDLLN